MKNPFHFSDDNKRYLSYNYYLRHRFGSKVFKVGLNAGFTCPNRDGTCGTGGCTFCNAIGSGDFGGNQNDEVDVQFSKGFESMQKKWPKGQAIAYFQSFSNTYASLERLKKLYDPFIQRSDVIAIAIATRADCLDDETIAYLDSLTLIKDVWLELGLQSSDDKTALRIHRGHDFDCIKNTFTQLKHTSIKTTIHLMNGLPGENSQTMLQTARDVAALHPNAVKIHMLNVLKNTAMADEFTHDPFPILTMDDYIDIVIRQLELLPPDIVIQRLTGDGDATEIIAPIWVKNKIAVLNGIDKEMKRRDTWQGIHYSGENPDLRSNKGQ